MASIEFLTIEADDPTAAQPLYTALGLDQHVQLRATTEPTSGFRGWTLSLVAAQPANVNALMVSATDAGATVLKPATKSLWGYGGALRAADGTIVTLASSSKKDTGPATLEFDEVVLQLGVTDVAATKAFYVEHGLEVGKSFGRKYVEFAMSGPIALSLTKRGALAKVAGVDPDGTGSHRLAVASDVGPFTDPDGIVWGRPDRASDAG
ncbi:glyoxalase [Ornithinimicrobium sp. F0845]|uniref:glyoxalase n=1 Tax=Ornithinimicrobium sp. F0845 TaxID=2926412 RepID=UPI001FF676FA|nr:glyoxalase [Ornithinimicrobium sp. F0845]MCK0111213.1 glyoxalase [Ornithinimicrobium sp. F0845]